MGITMNMNSTAMLPLRMPTHEENDLLCRSFGDLPTTPHTDSNDLMNNASGSFVTKLFAMVETEPDSVVTWIREGTAFCIVQPKVLAETYLPKYFRHGRFSSLIRQLNFYSFYKVTEGSAIIYQHSHFRKGRPDLLVHIKRRGAGKAKDPWIDPLSTKQRFASEHDAPIYAPLHINHANQPLPISTGDLCSSPSSKPLSTQTKQTAMILKTENMSPALKPGTSPMIMPPVVDLNGGRKEMSAMMKQPRSGGTHIMASSTMFGVKENPSTGSLIAVRSLDQQDMCMRPPLWRTSSSSHEMKGSDLMEFAAFPKNGKADMTSDQMKDEMIDHAILDNLTFGDMLDHHSTSCHNSAQVDPRTLVLARNCLKGPAAMVHCTDDSAPSHPSSSMMHNNSMLFDPADVHHDDDDTWEMPLSPLNDPEDIPWLDLSF
ncbi:hypothetical protein DYB32_006459 [Aphanomyces invadans]|uniref:HSF-type DNA-binding domain-containing protein n=1 Tax=Aphanomyces invadans TaxID=157072 RepID=A0A3R6Y6D6_9STRA|nr:hypothetical protein DYB32_006459 [Aphanomyces invadans]